jgi:tRNA (guanine-N7-)-methyltransferase
LRPRQQLLLAQSLPRMRFGAEFLTSEPVFLEIGFGGGEHAIAQIGHLRLIACEVFENGICSLLSRIVPEGEEATATPPDNLRLWDRDARILLRQLPPGCLAGVFLLFPDPWPKLRHAKRRFLQPANIALLAGVLRPGGEWRIASDDPTYQDWVDAQMAEQSEFRLQQRSDTRPPGWPPTRYEAKALRAGRKPVYWSYRRA